MMDLLDNSTLTLNADLRVRVAFSGNLMDLLDNSTLTLKSGGIDRYASPR
jgi:hypothetical protein